MKVTPTLLLIIDGWGQAPKSPGNAVLLSKTPTIDALLAHPSRTILACSGREVGLPVGFMGNSEVGHLNIGAGRIVNQDITRIDLTIEEKTFATTPVIAKTIAATKKAQGRLHLIGLLSDGGVHAHMNHLFAMINAAQEAGVPVVLHMLMDGRDTAPQGGIDYLRQLLPYCNEQVRLGSLCGRYFAMDRDSRWERVARAWNLIVHGVGQKATDPLQVCAQTYTEGKTDEFIEPTLLVGADGTIHTVAENDAVFFLNFRADRARQLSRAFGDVNFTSFERGKIPRLSALATMTAYDATLPLPAAFPRANITETLGETVSKQGLAQLRIAETEKYAHVTYFFNGGAEKPFAQEERHLIPSPKDVATYDEKPEMSVHQVTQTLIAEWNKGVYDFVVCNFANLDMVGHTGKIPAVIKACEVVDGCVAEVLAAVKHRKGRLVITADHGNAEEMISPDGNTQTSHSKNPVALIVVDEGPVKNLRAGGKLGDIGPTILHLWGLKKPELMTGNSLWEEKK